MTISEVRELFPHLGTGQIYFNHAALGPWSTPVLNRISEYAAQRSSAHVENYKFFLAWNAEAKKKLSALLGTVPDRIAWVDNVSNGLNILAQGLKWESGDRIILNNLEFPSNVYPFMNLQKDGVVIDFAEALNGTVNVNSIEKLITPRTKLVSISLVQFLSGYRADIDAIGELCRRRNIIFCVDAIQAAGVVEIDVNNSKIDFLAGGSQKWLMSSQGLSYIYLSEEMQERINQKNVGWTSVNQAWDLLDYKLNLKSTADRFQSGTVNTLGVAIFEAGLDLFIDYGMKNVEAAILENTGYFIDRLTELGIDPILKEVGVERRAGIVTFKHEKADEIFKYLESREIYCAVRVGMVRLSPHFYNTKEEIDRVIYELDKFQRE